jgi:hypothetical protein
MTDKNSPEWPYISLDASAGAAVGNVGWGRSEVAAKSMTALTR